MPMTKSKAMALAGPTCKVVDARGLASLSSILSTRTASPIARKPARATQRKHLGSSPQLGGLQSHDGHSARTPRRAANTHSIEGYT
eukprot:5073053-Pyramimonas_sp.AAC.1